MAAGVVHLPWYATGFRGDALEQALAEIAPVALRYGATRYQVQRGRDDRYKFFHMSAFPDKLSWERYWYGEEFTRWRSTHSGWYQVPILYAWYDLVASGELTAEPAAAAVE